MGTTTSTEYRRQSGLLGTLHFISTSDKPCSLCHSHHPRALSLYLPVAPLNERMSGLRVTKTCRQVLIMLSEAF